MITLPDGTVCRNLQEQVKYNQENMEQNANNIKTLVTQVNGLELWLDSSTYILELRDGNGQVLSTIDLPLEAMVVGARYDEEAKSIVMTLNNGSEIIIPVGDLVDGLISKTEADTLYVDKYVGPQNIPQTGVYTYYWDGQKNYNITRNYSGAANTYAIVSREGEGNAKVSTIKTDASGNYPDPTTDTTFDQYIVNKEYADTHYLPIVPQGYGQSDIQLYGKTTDGKIVVMGTQTGSPGAYSIARRGANGVLYVGTPLDPQHAATKKYVDDAVAGGGGGTGGNYVEKIDNTTGLPIVYGVTGSNVATAFAAISAEQPNTIVMRDEYGHMSSQDLASTDDGYTVANKNYVDQTTANVPRKYLHNITFQWEGEAEIMFQMMTADASSYLTYDEFAIASPVFIASGRKVPTSGYVRDGSTNYCALNIAGSTSGNFNVATLINGNYSIKTYGTPDNFSDTVFD